MYLLGEARKEEERLEAGGLLGSSQAVNKVLSHLRPEIRTDKLSGMWQWPFGSSVHMPLFSALHRAMGELGQGSPAVPRDLRIGRASDEGINERTMWAEDSAISWQRMIASVK